VLVAKIKGLVFLVSCLFALADAGTGMAQWKLPPLPSHELYGNILINRTSVNNGVKPVGFSHWSHRIQYTCKVCHLELEFNMKVNTTEITEKTNQEGRYCGACHDGETAFGHTKQNCNKCHSGDIGYGQEKFKKLKGFPQAAYGNKIDWDKALTDGFINPKVYFKEVTPSINFDKDLLLEAEWTMIPPAKFSHKGHLKWLDCSNCHPEIFNIQKKTTKHFEMIYILDNKFCGFCHGKVAFPINNCKRCHPDMKGGR